MYQDIIAHALHAEAVTASAEADILLIKWHRVGSVHLVRKQSWPCVAFGIAVSKPATSMS